MNQEQRAIARFKEQRDTVRETISGYAQAAVVIKQEQMKRLAQMTPEEAQAIYDNLCHSWYTWKQTLTEDSLKRLDQWRLETLVSVRAALVRLAHITVDKQ